MIKEVVKPRRVKFVLMILPFIFRKASIKKRERRKGKVDALYFGRDHSTEYFAR